MDDNELYKKLLGQAIRKRRIEQQKTLEQVASDTQLDDKHLGKLENGKKSPLFHTMLKLSRALDFSVDELIKEVEEELENKQRE